MKASFLDAAERRTFEMGCYDRRHARVAAAIEQNNDARGIAFRRRFALSPRAGADRLPEERRRCARRLIACTTSSSRRGSMCCG